MNIRALVFKDPDIASPLGQDEESENIDEMLLVFNEEETIALKELQEILNTKGDMLKTLQHAFGAVASLKEFHQPVTKGPYKGMTDIVVVKPDGLTAQPIRFGRPDHDL